MVKPCVYIDYSFFKFLLLKGNSFSNPMVREGKSEYNLMMDFLFDSGIDIVCHIEEDEPDDFELIRVLEDLHVQGKVVLKKADRKTFEDETLNIGRKSPFSLCCIALPEPPKMQRVTEAGFTCITRDNFDKFLKMPFFKQNAFEVAKDGEIGDWSDFSKLSHNFNSIVIFDSYLFALQHKKSRSEYTETISELISNLLVNNNSKLIKVLIAFPKLQPQQEIRKSLVDLQSHLEETLNKKLNGEKDVRIGLAKIPQKTSINHDRMIFTNFMVLFSGDSFNYFQKGLQPSIETILSSYTMLDWQNNFQSYLKKLQKLKKVIPTLDKLGTQAVRAGDCDLEFLKFM